MKSIVADWERQGSKMRSTMPFTIRYAETDMMGVVHHANYVLYFEDARTKLLDDLGYPYARIEEEGYMSPVVSVELHYGKPLRYAQKPIVRTRVACVTPMKVTFGYEIFESVEAMEAGEKPNCSGQSVHCIVEVASFKPVSMKKATPELFELYKSTVEEG